MISTALLSVMATGATLFTQPPLLDSADVYREQFESACRTELGFEERDLRAAELFLFRRCVVRKDAAVHRLKTLQDRTTRVQDIYGTSRKHVQDLRVRMERRFLRARTMQLQRQVIPHADMTRQERSDMLKRHRASIRERQREAEQRVYDASREEK